REDARHLGAGPAAPADRDRTVAVAFLEIASRVGPDSEVGDRRDLRKVEAERRGVDLPVRQEAEDLAAEARRRDRGLRLNGGVWGRRAEAREEGRTAAERRGSRVRVRVVDTA